VIICHIDCDVSGSTSIAHLVRSGHVLTFRCPTFKDAEGVMWGLHRGAIKADLVVLDTLTALAGVARQDLVMEPSQTKQFPIWDNREKLVADRQHYYKTADVINRLLRPLRELPMPSVFIAHERSTRGMESRVDPLSGTDKFIPNLQREINDNIFSFADGIVRLFPSSTPFEWQGAHVPTGTRILLLSATSDSAAGVRVPADKPPAPPIMVVPENDPYSFVRFIEAVGGEIPHNLVVYGPPKIGKTTWVAGAAYLTGVER
jgi:hypothetical protein